MCIIRVIRLQVHTPWDKFPRRASSKAQQYSLLKSEAHTAKIAALRRSRRDISTVDTSLKRLHRSLLWREIGLESRPTRGVALSHTLVPGTRYVIVSYGIIKLLRVLVGEHGKKEEEKRRILPGKRTWSRSVASERATPTKRTSAER